MNDVEAPRFNWRPDLLVVTTGLMVSTGLIRWLDLDLTVAGWFFREGRWWLAEHPVCETLAALAVPLTLLVSLGSIGVMLVAHRLRRGRLVRRQAALLFLAFLLGPGVVVNALLKEHTGRPRPVQVQEFGGRYCSLPVLVKGQAAQGKSFPCGHASVGFSLCAVWFLWRRRRPRLAAGVLVAAVSLGAAIGLARMAAGAHFLSDVLWSAGLSYLVALAVYAWILRLPALEDASHEVLLAPLPPPSRVTVFAYSFGIAVFVAGTLLAWPVYKVCEYRFVADDEQPPPRWVELEVDRGDVRIELVDMDQALVEVDGTVRGFGLPSNEVIRRGDYLTVPEPHVRYSLLHTGVFTERDSFLRLRASSRQLDRVVVKVGDGDITVIAEDGAPVPLLELTTATGEVVRPPLGEHARSTLGRPL